VEGSLFNKRANSCFSPKVTTAGTQTESYNGRRAIEDAMNLNDTDLNSDAVLLTVDNNFSPKQSTTTLELRKLTSNPQGFKTLVQGSPKLDASGTFP